MTKLSNKSAFILASLFFCGAVIASSTGVVKLDVKKGGGRWTIFEKPKSDCAFIARYVQGAAKPVEFSARFNDCDAVLEIDYSAPAGDLVIADASSERGGSVYLMRPGASKINALLVNYEGSDEDQLKVSVQGKTLKLSTSIETIEIALLPDGAMKIVGKKQKKRR